MADVAHQGAGSSSLAHVHLCSVCEGSGLRTEVYECRRLEVRAGRLKDGVSNTHAACDRQLPPSALRHV
jgi:hypothetical protein